jgi:LysM repeat protein
MKRIAIVGCLVLVLTSIGLLSCTRARPEPVAPTVPAAATTPLATLPGPTTTVVITPQPPPTSVPSGAGPTTVSVAGATPTAAPGTAPVLATPITVLPTSPPSGTFEHTVQWGDTLFSLARRYNTTVEALAALNGIQNPSAIEVGQVLQISGSAGSAPGSFTPYTVQPGDTLYGIAARFGKDVGDLIAANGLADPYWIWVGQVLVIP